MPPYLFDTSVIMEIIRENPKYDRYSSEEMITTDLNLGELYFNLLRQHGEKEAELWNNILKNTTIDMSQEAIIAAMRFRYGNMKRNLSFVDCVSYTMARMHKIMFLTGDKGFTGLPDVELVI